MDLFFNALKEALDKNTTELQKWTKHKEELFQTEQNIKEFKEKLQVECMVPIGTKALMPGHLYHTSEILVGHGSKVFSKCTAQQALKICEQRQKYAEDRIEALKTERDLHKNKLELPFMENAFSAKGEEIIEEYDEEKERIWREDHRKKVAASKKQEAEERKINNEREKSDNDVMDMLDELELMEELEKELEDMNVSTDDQLKKLMSGEIKPLVSKHRISHYDKSKNLIIDGSILPDPNDKDQPLPRDSIVETKPLVQSSTSSKSAVIAEASSSSENNIMPDTKKFEKDSLKLSKPSKTETAVQSSNKEDEGTYSAESDMESGSDIDSSISEQVYQQFLKILEEAKHLTRKEKRRHLKSKLKEVQLCLTELVVHDAETLTTKIDLSDLKDCIEDEIIRSESDNDSGQADQSNETSSRNFEKLGKKSKIKFAQEDEIKLIDKYEAPCQVSVPDQSNKKNLTLEIKFKHSDVAPTETKSESENEDDIVSPIDIYKKFEHCMKRKQVNKSILKNKEKVMDEAHMTTSFVLPKKASDVKRNSKKAAAKKNLVPTNLLGDVIERSVMYKEESQRAHESENSKSEDIKISKFKASRSKKSDA